MRFTLSEDRVARMRAMQAANPSRLDAVTASEDAFLLDPGLGPAGYLTFDGRVLVDGRDWDEGPIREATDDEACAYLVVGAKKMGVPEWLALVPSMPLGGIPCPQCSGDRWITMGREVGTDAPGRMICWTCSGRGWREPRASNVPGQ
jgi:hypothetical protein